MTAEYREFLDAPMNPAECVAPRRVDRADNALALLALSSPQAQIFLPRHPRASRPAVQAHRGHARMTDSETRRLFARPHRPSPNRRTSTPNRRTARRLNRRV